MKLQSRIINSPWALIAVSFIALLLGGCSTTTSNFAYSYTDANGQLVKGNYSYTEDSERNQAYYDNGSSEKLGTVPYDAKVTITGWTVNSDIGGIENDPVEQAINGCVAKAIGEKDPSLNNPNNLETLLRKRDAAKADPNNSDAKACKEDAAKNASHIQVQCPAKGTCDRNRLPILIRNKGQLPLCVCPNPESGPPACDSPAFGELDADGKAVWTECLPAEKEAIRRKQALDAMTKEQLKKELEKTPNDPLLKSMMGGGGGCRMVYSMVTHSYVCQ